MNITPLALKRLNKAVDILKERYKHEIYADHEWNHFLWSWTINIYTDEDDPDPKFYKVTAYRALNNTTDYSDWIELPSYPIEFELSP